MLVELVGCYFNAFELFLLCRKLKRLNLGGNELTSVPQRALSIFDNLKKLEIQENKIRVIKEGDFEGKYRTTFAVQFLPFLGPFESIRIDLNQP